MQVPFVTRNILDSLPTRAFPCPTGSRHLKSLITWLLAQVLWLGFAYLLEFCGKAVFFELWIASVTFLGANAWLLVDVIKRRRVSAEAVADQIR